MIFRKKGRLTVQLGWYTMQILCGVSGRRVERNATLDFVALDCSLTWRPQWDPWTTLWHWSRRFTVGTEFSGVVLYNLHSEAKDQDGRLVSLLDVQWWEDVFSAPKRSLTVGSLVSILSLG